MADDFNSRWTLHDRLPPGWHVGLLGPDEQLVLGYLCILATLAQALARARAVSLAA